MRWMLGKRGMIFCDKIIVFLVYISLVRTILGWFRVRVFFGEVVSRGCDVENSFCVFEFRNFKLDLIGEVKYFDGFSGGRYLMFVFKLGSEVGV